MIPPVSWRLFSVLLLAAARPAQDRREPAPALWQEIRYAAQPGPWSHGKPLDAMLIADRARRVFTVYLSFVFQDGDTADQALLAALIADRADCLVSVRLHSADGVAVPPLGGQPKFRGGSGHMGETCARLTCEFEMRQDALADAWLELRGDRTTAWLEIPYGCLANDGERDSGTRKASDRPLSPARCQGFAPEHLVIEWKSVQYELAPLSDGTQVRLSQTNATWARSELVLGREAGRWDLYEPRSTVRLLVDGAEAIVAKPVELSLSEDQQQRRDVHLLRESGKGRCVGQLIVTVAGEEQRLWLPSSLFRWGHGHGPREVGVRHR